MDVDKVPEGLKGIASNQRQRYASADPSSERVLNRVGRYEITEKLGQGGMGTVYKAFDPLLTRVVAVKVISGQLDSNPDHRERFFREARAAAQLSHRNIITIYDLGEQDGAPYLAMEYLEGRDLDQRLHDARGHVADAQAGAGPEHLRRAGARPRLRADPPRHQAGQRLRHRRWRREDPRLRPRPADHVRADAQQRHGRHRELHGARATARRAAGPPGGHLLVRRAALRAARGAQALSGRFGRLDDVQDPARGALRRSTSSTRRWARRSRRLSIARWPRRARIAISG